MAEPGARSPEPGARSQNCLGLNPSSPLGGFPLSLGALRCVASGCHSQCLGQEVMRPGLGTAGGQGQKFQGYDNNLENDSGLEQSGGEERVVIIILSENQSPLFLLVACDFLLFTHKPASSTRGPWSLGVGQGAGRGSFADVGLWRQDRETRASLRTKEWGLGASLQLAAAHSPGWASQSQPLSISAWGLPLG